MNRRTFCTLSASALAATALPARAQAPQSGICTPVLKRSYDNSNTGANLAETTLTQANVLSQGIRQIFTLPMEGDARGCEAAPLIVPSVAVDDGTTRDLCIVCSMNGLVYAFDANDSDIIWCKKLSVPVNGSKSIDAWMVNDHWSVLSTPVIDAQTNRLYAVAWTSATGNAATGYYQMHVLNLKDGSRVCPPVPIEGTSNGQTWNSMMRKQRSSLLMTNVGGKKTVFFGCGTVSESAVGAAGWVVAFDCANNRVLAALALSNGEGAGVWMGGSGLVADASGYLYAVTGNGGFSPPNDFGESVIKIQYTGSALKVVDHWTPFLDAARDGGVVDTAKIAGFSGPSRKENLPVNAGMRAMAMGANSYAGWSDQDFGSGGLLLTPSGALIACGKDGTGYVVNSQSLGQTTPAQIASGANFAQLLSPPLWLTYFPGYGTSPDPTNPTALDILPGGKTRHMHSCPVTYKNAAGQQIVFVWGENSPLRAWSLANGTLTFLAQGNEMASANVTASPGGMPGGFMCISANGSKTGTPLIYASIPYGNANETISPGRFLIYDAEHFVNGAIKPLWDSQQWNIAYSHNKFNVPVVSGGKVFLPTYDDQVLVFGLA